MLNETDTLPENVRHNRATFSPEDGKIRLYLSARVERDSYLYLRQCKYVATPKQDCAFVAPWSVAAEDAALALIPEDADIEDEDYSAADRSADRAERFEEYRDKRRAEAMDAAGNHGSMDSVYGNQSQSRAQSFANRRDRYGSRAVTQWGKAEYWQERTRGVIDAALYKLKPGVRRGRLKRLETELRKIEKERDYSVNRWDSWVKVAQQSHNPELQDGMAKQLALHDRSFMYYEHPDHPGDKIKESSLSTLLSPHREGMFRPITGAEAAALALARYPENGPCGEGSGTKRWIDHLNHRIAYERAMIEAEGGMAGEADMVVGGWLGNRQIWKINKSSTTGRVVSVGLLGDGTRAYWQDEAARKLKRIVTVNVERLGQEVYRAPTEDELKAFAESRKQLESENPSLKMPPLINPTLADAERLVKHWNNLGKAESEEKKRSFEALTFSSMTKAEWKSKSAYTDRYATIYLTADGLPTYRREKGFFRVRARQEYGRVIGNSLGLCFSIVHLSDAASKPLPLDWDRIENPQVVQEQPAESMVTA
jgi:hypothetical protein